MCPRFPWRIVLSAVIFTTLAVPRAYGAEMPKPSDLGFAALSKGDWAMAVTQFDKAVRAEPGNAHRYYDRSQAYSLKGDFDLAIADLTEAIRLAPNYALAYRNRGAFYLAKGDYNRAIADCDQAIRRGLKDWRTYNNRGFAYLRNGNVASAIADLNEAIRTQPRCGLAYTNRALAWFGRRLFDRAIADLDEAIRIDAKNVGAIDLRAGAYLSKGEFARALADINEAIRLDPGSSDAFERRAVIYYLSGEKRRALEDFTQAIRLDPASADAYAQRGTCLALRGEYDKAMADFNDAIRRNPRSPCLYEIRGALRVSRGDYERGAADVAHALRLNPADPAATFDNSPPKALTQAASQHGERQLRQMLRDRPAMATFGEKDAAVLYEWAARKFAGEDFGQIINWDASGAPAFTTAATYPSPVEGPAFIRASRTRKAGREGTDRSFEELWHDVVFELYNTLNAKDFRQLTAEAGAGSLSEEEFVARVIECESRAAEKTRAFYIHVFMPWARQQGVPTDPYLWGVSLRWNPEEKLLLSTLENDGWWRAYALRYDLIVLDSLARKGEYRKALDLAARACKQAEAPDERTTVFRYTGYCLLQLNQPRPALDAFNEAVRVQPGDANGYLARATAYETLGELDHAVADYAEAIRVRPADPEAYLLRGKAFEALGDRDRANADFAVAKRLAQNVPAPIQSANTNKKKE